MKIAIACDHVAVSLKKELLEYLQGREGLTLDDLGTEDGQRVDYPTFAGKLARAVADGTYTLGILLCGTGAGMSIAANKVKGIRAVVCSEPYTAKLSREHNDSNVLCMGARVIGAELAKMIADAWLDAQFEGGRHQVRVDMINKM